MKITISCPGRFHSYNLAHQVSRFNALQKLITTFPKFEITKYGVPRDRITSLLYWEILNRGWAKFTQWTGGHREVLQHALGELFDVHAARFIPDATNIFIGWSNSCEAGLKIAKSKGALTIVERGSSHIEAQTELLEEEYDQMGKADRRYFTHAEVIEKEKREYELADYISVPSTFAKRSFIEKGIPAEKIIQNPYGVDLTSFKPGEKSDDVFRIIYVGQMSLRKGVHYLLEAFDTLKLPHAELVLIGGMTQEIAPFFEKYSGSFTYLGSKPQSELNRYYNNASVFAICSIEEGLAMVQIQAMASGLPVLCTTNTGGEDLIDEGKQGFIIPIRNVEYLMEKLLWFYENPEATKNMGLSAASKVSRDFTWDAYGNRYLDFLRSVHGN